MLFAWDLLQGQATLRLLKRVLRCLREVDGPAKLNLFHVHKDTIAVVYLAKDTDASALAGDHGRSSATEKIRRPVEPIPKTSSFVHMPPFSKICSHTTAACSSNFPKSWLPSSFLQIPVNCLRYAFQE